MSGSVRVGSFLIPCLASPFSERPGARASRVLVPPGWNSTLSRHCRLTRLRVLNV